MMEAEQIAILFERQYKSLEKRNHDLMSMTAELAAKVADLEAQLAARDAEIAAWLRGGGVYQHPGPATIAAHERLATAIESGAYRKETP